MENKEEIMWDNWKNKPWWIHVTTAIGIFLIVLFVALKWAGSYTRHGEKIPVPNMIDQPLSLLLDGENPHDFEYTVTDSTYEPGKPGGIITDQDPRSGSFVKEGRKIYLSVTAYDVPKTPFPVKEGFSLRMATALIENNGFHVGEIEEKPTDVIKHGSYILEAKCGNKILKYGDLLPKGSTINLVMAVASLDSMIDNPVLTGLSLPEAIQLANAQGIDLMIK